MIDSTWFKNVELQHASEIYTPDQQALRSRPALMVRRGECGLKLCYIYLDKEGSDQTLITSYPFIDES